MPRLENDNCSPNAHEILHARSVPVGEANASVASSAANCLRIIRAVNTDARLVQAQPQNADEIVRARGEIVIILSSHAVVQHAFIVAEPGPNVCAQDFPCADRRRQSFRAGRDREHTDELIVIEDLE